MKRNINLWQTAGFAVTAVFGTLLHFLYDWTGSKIAALFSAVNESTWEHMKLLFFPMFAFAIVQSFYFDKEYKNFWCIKLKGILLGLVLIPVIFYTARGIFGSTPDWVNIGIFFVAAATAFICEARKFKKGSMPCNYSKWAIVWLCLITVLFWVYTFVPPQIPLFQDPIDGSFGLQ